MSENITPSRDHQPSNQTKNHAENSFTNDKKNNTRGIYFRNIKFTDKFLS